jgi:GT2 family glycosyltransferase
LSDQTASVIIVTYNHLRYLERCLDSVEEQDYPHEIIIVDNDSTDGTPKYIEEKYPKIIVIRNKNTGYGAGNNLGVRYASGEYVVILNPDTLVEKNWLKNLLVPIQSDPSIITTPKILLFDGSAINTCGNINHFTGLTFTRGLNDPPESHDQTAQVSGISGACFAMRKEEYMKLGGFDERFFVYNEDSELSWRSHFFHMRILFVPSSLVRHDYSLTVSPGKIYALEKGRYLILKTYLSPGFFLVLLPSLLIAEFLTFGYAIKSGREGLVSKCKALRDGILLPGNPNAHRDAQVLECLETKMPLDQLVSGKSERLVLRICNIIFSWNYNIFRRIFIFKS